MLATRVFFRAIFIAAAICLISGSTARPRGTQEATQKPTEKAPEKTPERAQEKPAAKATSKLPAEIELLETSVRFETDGSSRKEVHARVKINDELGARQFARLNFNFNRAFEQVEIPLVRITHASGGTADVLPSAISDNPNPAVANAPAYQDIRVKSVRILGLEPGDSLEYRVITTVSHHPLAPDFWLEHSFDRSGVVSHEIFELDLPSSKIQEAKVAGNDLALRINPATPVSSTSKSGEGESAHTSYRWEYKVAGGDAPAAENSEPDVVYSTIVDWHRLSVKLAERLLPGAVPLESLQAYEAPVKEMSRRPEVAAEVKAKAAELTEQSKTDKERLEALYDFVSRKIASVDLPLGTTGFAVRHAREVLATGYATQEDKFVLFAALATAVKLNVEAALTGYCEEKAPARPPVFKRLLVSASVGKRKYWLDPTLEVAPFGLIPANSGKCVFVLNRLFYAMNSTGHVWERLGAPLPFAAKQVVTIEATLSTDGTLTSRPKYVIRGENELLLRTAFHQSPKDKWDSVAQLLALSDGFRGKVGKVAASDPYETHKPFTVEFEISQPKFVDWSKKPVRIPAILPLLGLPDPPAKQATGAAPVPIDLGTPLDVTVSATLHIPAGTTASVPTGTSVERDFATYTSQYSSKDGTLTATRHLNFILREISADRAADYNAFLRTVQNDESQFFTLEDADSDAARRQKR